MPKIFVTSDTWFNRPANVDDANVNDYNDFIISNWNDAVGKNDIVYVLGGFGISDLYHIALKLNGKIHFLNNYFNADEVKFIKQLKDQLKKSSDPKIARKFIFDKNQIITLIDADVVLSYFPLSEWCGKNSGTFCFHGMTKDINIMENNITCSSFAWDFTPICIQEVITNIHSFKKQF